MIALTVAPTRVGAAINLVTVNATRNYENARGYTYAEITVHGSVARADGSVGLYVAPAVLIYPRHHRANRVGVVDWVNSAFYHFFPPTTEFGTFQFTLLATEQLPLRPGIYVRLDSMGQGGHRDLRTGRAGRR